MNSFIYTRRNNIRERKNVFFELTILLS
jgi:hypothetical protein